MKKKKCLWRRSAIGKKSKEKLNVTKDRPTCWSTQKSVNNIDKSLINRHLNPQNAVSAVN